MGARLVAGFMDQRKNERHRINGRVWYHWKDDAGADREDVGSLRDVSALGLFVETNTLPPTGTEMSIRFDFTGAELNPAVRVSAKGSVVRIAVSRRDGESSGFAVSTGRMTLQKISTPPSETTVSEKS